MLRDTVRRIAGQAMYPRPVVTRLEGYGVHGSGSDGSSWSRDVPADLGYHRTLGRQQVNVDETVLLPVSPDSPVSAAAEPECY